MSFAGWRIHCAYNARSASSFAQPSRNNCQEQQAAAHEIDSMQSRNLLAVIAGQSSIFAVLTLVLVLSIAGAPLLQQKKAVAQHIGADVAMMKADALSEAILADFDGARALDRTSSAFVATHRRGALAPGAADAHDEYTRNAVAA